MGLAGPRKRTKIVHDPNNTTWTRKKGFGHNILVSQGWSPGETLGARDAPHAGSYTAASHSHIRASFREENLGLGARQSGYQNGTESTGLDAFQGILGRLNGKTDETLAKEQKSRDDTRRHIYAERKWGSLRFVGGGTLHGDDIYGLISSIPQHSSADDASDTRQSASDRSKSQLKEASREEEVTKKQRKEAKQKRKAEKAQRKLERAQRKAAQVLGREPKHSSTEAEASASVTGTQSPMARVSRSGTSSRTESPSGRQAVRQRYIQQKRMALTDAKALKEILMVKI